MSKLLTLFLIILSLSAKADLIRIFPKAKTVLKESIDTISDKEIGKISINPLKYNSTPSDWKNYYKAQSPEIFPKEADDLKKNPFYFYIILQEDFTLIYSKGKHELLKTILEVACGNKWNTSAAKETIGADLADKADNSTNLNLQIAQTRWQTFKANKVKVEEEIFEAGGKGVQGAGGVYNSFTKAIDFGGDILKIPGKKLNILGRANPKNGTIGTKQLFNELKVKGVPENEMTGLFTQMPSEWNNLSVIDMNTKYWNEINKIHIEDIISNNGPIRFIHDPRLVDNHWNYVADMLDGPFKQKCISEGLVKVKTFMKMEYDYLLSKGYVLQETGLMIKP